MLRSWHQAGRPKRDDRDWGTDQVDRIMVPSGPWREGWHRMPLGWPVPARRQVGMRLPPRHQSICVPESCTSTRSAVPRSSSPLIWRPSRPSTDVLDAVRLKDERSIVARYRPTRTISRKQVTSPATPPTLPAPPVSAVFELPAPPPEFPPEIAHTTAIYFRVLEPHRIMLARAIVSATDTAQGYEDILLHANVVRLEFGKVTSSIERAQELTEQKPPGPSLDRWPT